MERICHSLLAEENRSLIGRALLDSDWSDRMQQPFWRRQVYLKKTMTVCAASGCKNRLSKGCGKHFFRFPLKNPEKLAKWIAAVRREKWTPTIYSRLCSDHFTEQDYMLRPGASSPYLRTDAVPSIFPGLSPPLKKNKKIKTERAFNIDPLPAVAEPIIPEPSIPEQKLVDQKVASADHTYSSVSNDKENDAPPAIVNSATVKMRKKIKRLQKQVLRQRNKIRSMKLLLTELKRHLANNVQPIYYLITSADDD
ncbi:THAP domain-containing 1-like [Pelobates cultripes]|uniref:THAP domain-containing 1-like n=2 Tax=Pelobates cultripes TaxID=61616 RepID=A0AAD1TLI4_PELCU|nr:THAP domain-containing 1-like [Pelobates cultripes]